MASEVERAVIDALLACLPLSDDGTGHVVDCGYDEDAPSCGCLSLPGRLAAVIAAHDAEVAARAIRGTADRWTQGAWSGAWSDVMLPKPTPPAVPVIAYSNRVGDWLRACADALAASQGAGESGEGDAS